MLSTAGSDVYEASSVAYNGQVRGTFTIGDMIRKARKERHWDQQRLGEEALRFQIVGNEKKINKATISKLEGSNPYTSEFGVVWRVLATLGLSFTDVERIVGPPFLVEHKAGPAKASSGRSRA